LFFKSAAVRHRPPTITTPTTVSSRPVNYGPLRANGGNTTFNAARGPHLGSLVALLPYLEQDNLFQNLRDSQQTYPIPAPR